MIKQLSLEFGGKDLRKLFDGANLEEFVATLILAAFSNQVSIVKRLGNSFPSNYTLSCFIIGAANVTSLLKKIIVVNIN